MFVRRSSPSARAVLFVELTTFVSGAAGVALMALRNGGLTSRYIQGVSAVLLFHVAFIPKRWTLAVLVSLACALTYPVVMAAGAFFVPELMKQWRTPASLALFIHDYFFVLATALIGSVASHTVWAARRQVFEARRLGRYRLKARIGAGGSGEVWLASDEQQRRDVALKILDVRAARQQGARSRFEREAKAASLLHSEHTIRVFDFGASDDGVYYLAMELLTGADLGTVVRERGALPPSRAVHFIRQACASLAEAHEQGVLHRDIKPENLFATRDLQDHLKVLDFGLAKVIHPEHDATLTQQGWAGGTPAYMAPEACAGLDVGAPADIYSLGAVLYFLLTGRPPFQHDVAPALINAHLHEIAAPPSRYAKDLPRELDEIVLRCLAKRPQDRPPSVRALDRALEEIGLTWSREQAQRCWSLTEMPVLEGEG
jgi:serine/threonine-protein kinase